MTIDSVLNSCPVDTVENAEAVIDRLADLDSRGLELWSTLLAKCVTPEKVQVATVPLIYACASIFNRYTTRSSVRRPSQQGLPTLPRQGDGHLEKVALELIGFVPSLDWKVQARLIPETVDSLFSCIGCNSSISKEVKQTLIAEVLGAARPTGVSCFDMAQAGFLPDLGIIENGLDPNFPPFSIHDIFYFFYHSAQAYESYTNWRNAAIFAALAVTVHTVDSTDHQLASTGMKNGEEDDSTGTVVSKWIEDLSHCSCLLMMYEVLAYGQFSQIPYSSFGLSFQAKSPYFMTVYELVRFFNSPCNQENAKNIREFVKDKEQNFRAWNLWDLVQKILVKYRVKQLHEIHSIAPDIAWSCLQETGPETLNQLILAGYNVEVDHGENNDGPLMVHYQKEPIINRETESTAAILQTVAKLSKRLKEMQLQTPNDGLNRLALVRDPEDSATPCYDTME